MNVIEILLKDCGISTFDICTRSSITYEKCKNRDGYCAIYHINASQGKRKPGYIEVNLEVLQDMETGDEWKDFIIDVRVLEKVAYNTYCESLKGQ